MLTDKGDVQGACLGRGQGGSLYCKTRVRNKGSLGSDFAGLIGFYNLKMEKKMTLNSHYKMSAWRRHRH